jgi:sugar-specific transcriptional regulator TrmB
MKEFGLTEYETMVYLQLSGCQEASAAELSRNSGVAYTKVYSVLSSLTRKGLVEIMRGKPSIYRTVDPEKALEALKQNRVESISKAYNEAVSSLRTIRPSGTKPAVGEHGASWNIVGKRNVINRLLEELSSARKDVKVVFPDLEMLGKPILNKILENKRHLQLKILASPNDERFLKGASGVEVEFSDAIKSRYAVFDDKCCLMLAVETPEYWTGVFETCGNCTRQAWEHFDLAWKAAEDN